MISHNGHRRGVWHLIAKNYRAVTSSLLRYLQNSYRAKVQGTLTMKPIIGTFYVTHYCNLSCLYCTEKYPERETTPVETAQALEFLRKMRTEVQILYFTGGEPLLRSDMAVLAREARRMGFYPIYLGTNGLLLRDREDVLPYIDRLVISLDSLDEDKWDRVLNAGRGKTRRILDNIEWVLGRQAEHDFNLVVNSVISTDTLGDVYQVMEYCAERDIVWSPAPAQDHSRPDPSLRENPRYQELVAHILERKAQGANIMGSVSTLRCMLTFQPFTCYATLVPHVYPDGSVFFPCQPLGQVAANLKDVDSISEAYRLGEKKYGKLEPCPIMCNLSCYVLSSFFVDHFWEMTRESIHQFAQK